MRKLLILALAGIPAFGAYNHVRPVVFHPVHGVTSDLTNFPATVNGTFFYLAGTSNGGGVINANGYDMIFTSDSGCTTTLNFERKFWNRFTGQAEFYVNIPTLSHTADTTIYLCYGNSLVSSDQQNTTATWDTNFQDVQHFGTPSLLNTTDSTGKVTMANSGSPSGARGESNGSIAFHSSTTDKVSGLSTGLNAASDRTFDVWLNPASFAPANGDTGVIDYGHSGVIGCVMFLTNDGTGTNRTAKFGCMDSSSFLHFAIGPALSLNRWYHLVGVYTSSNVYLYVNGNQYSGTTGNPVQTGDGTYNINLGWQSCCGSASAYLDAAMDEVRVSNIARSADWVKAEYVNLSTPDTFFSIGLETSNSSNITNVQVYPTNTQAVIRFTNTSDPSSCRVQVAENSTFYPVVHDTDTSLFSGSDLVNRDSSNIISGRTATVVEGKRYAAQYGTDGNRYSRALQQSTRHYYQITCNSGADTYAGTFKTATLAMGDTHLDGIPADPNSPGAPAWPSPTGFQRCNTTDLNCSISRRDTTYIDPQTGIQIRHLRMPDDIASVDANVQVPGGWFMGSGWSIPGDWNTAGDNATITGSTNPLVIGNWENKGSGIGNSAAFGSGDAITADGGYHVPTMLQYTITANVGNAGCTAGNTNPDCAMQVCVTLNWQTCAPNAQTYTQYLTTSPTAYTFGSGQPYDVMQKPGKRIWTQFETSWRPDQVTCDGSNTVTRVWVNGTIPPEEAPVGSYLFVQPLGIVQVTGNISALQFTVGSSCPAGTWSVNGSAFGILTWKETSSADTLTLSNPFTTDVAGSDKNPQYNSGFYGAGSTVTLANGDPAGLVQMFTSGQYSIDLLNGKVGAVMPSSPVNFAGPANQSSSFDDAGNFWVMGGDKSLIKFVYQGDYQTPITKTGHPELPLWAADGNATLPTCASPSSNECFQAGQTVTLPGHTLDVLLNAFDNRYTTNPFSLWYFTDIEMGKLIFDIHWGSAPAQNYWGWVMVFDPNATSNVNGAFGAGCVGQNTNPAGANYLTAGCIIAARRGWDGPGARWMTEKEVGQALIPGWMSIEETVNAFCVGGCQGGGPAVANKVSSASTGACPTNPYSLTSCITFTVDGDPFDFFAGSGNRNLGTYMVGDLAMLGVDDITYPNPPGGPSVKQNTIPMLKLVQISGTTLTFGCLYGPSLCAPTDVNPQMLWMYSSFPAFTYPWSGGPNGEGMFDAVLWNYANDPHGTNSGGNTIVYDYAMGGSHGFTANGLFSSGGSQTALCLVSTGCYTNQNFSNLSNAAFVSKVLTQDYNNVTGLTTISSSFSGRQGYNGACGNDNCQVHPDYSKLGSDPVSQYGIDGRPFVGIACIPCTSDVSNVTGTLYKAVNVSGSLHPKLFDTMGTTGRQILRNVSGPGSVIDPTSAGYYTMCQALFANECRSGSSAGDIYVNIPYANFAIGYENSANSACFFPPSGFAGSRSDNWTINDLCLYDSGMETQSYTRYAMNTFDMQGWSEQTFGHLFSPGRMDIFSGIHPATNITSSTYSQYYYFPAQFWDGVFATMLIKAPPISIDSGSRTGFQPIQVSIKQIPGADRAGVEFWYAEYNNHCSPNRNDTCVAVNATIDTNTPFYWESESYAAQSCLSSCTITVPALPEHVLYMRKAYYSGATIISRGPVEIVPVQ